MYDYRTMGRSPGARGRTLQALMLVCALALAMLATGPRPTPAQTPSPTSEPTPSPTPEPATGTIEGRMYADVNGNRTFDAWDAPLLLPVSVSGPIYPFSHTDATGTYRISGLPGGEYTVDVPVPVPAACTIARPYTWAGDPGRGGGCFTAPRLESRPQLAIVAAGQTATIDFIGVPFTTVSGWIWSDGSAASPLRQSLCRHKRSLSRQKCCYTFP